MKEFTPKKHKVFFIKYIIKLINRNRKFFCYTANVYQILLPFNATQIINPFNSLISGNHEKGEEF